MKNRIFIIIILIINLLNTQIIAQKTTNVQKGFLDL